MFITPLADAHWEANFIMVSGKSRATFQILIMSSLINNKPQTEGWIKVTKTSALPEGHSPSFDVKMKHVLTIVIILLGVYSCKKDKPNYQSFSEKELEFVSYTRGQTIKFIDTNNITHTFLQDHFHREFDEFVGMSGNTGDFQEEYEVAYNTSSPTSFYLTLFLYGGFFPYTPGELVIDFCRYKTVTNTTALIPPIDSTTINGQTYTKVYSIKMCKNGVFANNTDTATLLYNRQFGVLQLKFPSGKSITRTD